MKTLLAVALLAISIPAMADTVYKCVDPKTKAVTYSGDGCRNDSQQTRINTIDNAIMDGHGARREIAARQEAERSAVRREPVQQQPVAPPPGQPAAKAERKHMVRTGDGWDYKTDAQIAADEERRQRNKPTVCSTSGYTTSAGFTSGVAICR